MLQQGERPQGSRECKIMLAILSAPSLPHLTQVFILLFHGLKLY